MSTKTQTPLTQEEILTNATMADIARASQRSPRPMRQAISDSFSAVGRLANLADSLGEIAQLSLVSIKADMRREALKVIASAIALFVMSVTVFATIVSFVLLLS